MFQRYAFLACAIALFCSFELSAQIAPILHSDSPEFVSAWRLRSDATDFNTTPAALGNLKGLSGSFTYGFQSHDAFDMRRPSASAQLGLRLVGPLRLGLSMAWLGEPGIVQPFRGRAASTAEQAFTAWHTAWQFSKALSASLSFTHHRVTTPTGQTSSQTAPTLSIAAKPHNRLDFALTLRGFTAASPSPTPSVWLYTGFQPIANVAFALDIMRQSADYSLLSLNGPTRLGLSLAYRNPKLEVGIRLGQDFPDIPGTPSATSVGLGITYRFNRSHLSLGHSLSTAVQPTSAFSYGFNSRRQTDIQPTPNWVSFDLTGPLKIDRAPPSGLAQFFPHDTDPLEFKKRLIELSAKENLEHLKGLVIRLRNAHVSFGEAASLRAILSKIQQSGTEVFVHTDNMTDALMLAFGTTHIYMPSGYPVRLNGIHQNSTYFKDILDKMGINVQAFKAGTHKSATETFTQNSSSPEAKEMVTTYLKDLYDYVSKALDHDRNIPISKRDDLQSAGIFLSDEAYRLGLIDGLSTRSQFEKHAGLEKHHLRSGHKTRLSASRTKDVALIRIEGTIVPGRPSPEGILPSIGGDNAYADSIIDSLEHAAQNTRTHSVLLYIDSPGGDAYASKAIWEAVRTLNNKKPVVAYIESLGASGAYYAASAASKIIASPTSLVGSIGVYALIPDAKSFGDKEGIAGEVLGFGGPADPGLFTPLSPEGKIELQRYINELYQDFLESVSLTRNIPIEELKQVAEGQVFSGTTGKKNGLVDMLGDMSSALEITHRIGRKAKLKKDEKSQNAPKSDLENTLKNGSDEKSSLGTLLPKIPTSASVSPLNQIERFSRLWFSRALLVAPELLLSEIE